MFGFLKKKLKESVEKLASAVGIKEEEVDVSVAPPPEAPQPVEVVEPPRTALEEAKAARPFVEVPAAPPKEVREAPPAYAPEKPLGMLERLRRAVTEKVIEERDITPVLGDIQTGLLASDVALETAEKITEDLKRALVGARIPRGQVEKVVQESLRNSIYEILNQPDPQIVEMAKTKKPLKVIFLGFNGTGKTTSIAKLAHKLKVAGLRPVLAAGDTFRAAAIDQLEEHGRRLGVDVVKQKYGSDSAAVIFDAIKAAEARGYDVVLADTAGRSHANVNLMDEMKKVIRVNRPDLKILVVDSLTGNDAVEQARTFNAAVGVDGVIATKADVYEKGGAVLSTAWTIKKPILYIGTGQGYDDLQPFDARKIADGLLA